MRWPSRLIVKLLLGSSVLIALILISCAWLIIDEVERLTREDIKRHLHAQAMLLRVTLGERINADHTVELRKVIQEFTRDDPLETRITLIQADGTVLADSHTDATQLENHSEREEVRLALTSDQGWGESARFSRTMDRYLNYVALRVGQQSHPQAVVRVALADGNIAERTETNRRLIWRIVILGVLAAIVFATGLVMLWSKPLRRITVVARSLSRGDLTARARVDGRDELATLAQSLNQMRDNLAHQMTLIDRHRRNLAALLAQLHEGVIVANSEGNLVLINPAAIRLLGLKENASSLLVEKSIHECFDNPTVIRLLSPSPVSPSHDHDEARIQINQGNRPLWILMRAADCVLPSVHENDQPLTSAHETRQSGRMLVLTDVTELQQMMQMRTDFASNASHELRTPLSAIRGAAETLSKLDFSTEATAATNFIKMIDRHSRRLQNIMDDLLDLSKIESSPQRFKPSSISLDEILADLYQRHQDKLNEKNIRWEVHKSTDLDGVMLNTYLIRLILDNLIDNACKFTPPSGAISITCQRVRSQETDGSMLEISVADTGIGIPKEEQGRVFERFYQVSRDRSGGAQGTGLGLSIVRHSVLAMKGSITLNSEPNQGTLFAMRIPQPD